MMKLPTTKTVLTLATAAFCSASAFAQDAVPEAVVPTTGSPWKHAISVELFYGKPTDDFDEGPVDDTIDIAGFNVRCTLRSDELKFSNFVPEFFGIIGFGYGDFDGDNTYRYGSLYWKTETEVEIRQAQFAVGANLRWKAAESLFAFVSARIGAGFLSADVTRKVDGWKVFDEDDAEFGFLCGFGVGLEYAFTPHHAITLGYDFLISTAEPEQVGIKKQNYHMFSVGYKYSF